MIEQPIVNDFGALVAGPLNNYWLYWFQEQKYDDMILKFQEDYLDWMKHANYSEIPNFLIEQINQRPTLLGNQEKRTCFILRLTELYIQMFRSSPNYYVTTRLKKSIQTLFRIEYNLYANEKKGLGQTTFFTLHANEWLYDEASRSHFMLITKVINIQGENHKVEFIFRRVISLSDTSCFLSEIKCDSYLTSSTEVERPSLEQDLEDAIQASLEDERVSEEKEVKDAIVAVEDSERDTVDASHSRSYAQAAGGGNNADEDSSLHVITHPDSDSDSEDEEEDEEEDQGQYDNSDDELEFLPEEVDTASINGGQCLIREESSVTDSDDELPSGANHDNLIEVEGVDTPSSTGTSDSSDSSGKWLDRAHEGTFPIDELKVKLRETFAKEPTTDSAKNKKRTQKRKIIWCIKNKYNPDKFQVESEELGINFNKD